MVTAASGSDLDPRVLSDLFTAWVDTFLDHTVMLGHGDPLREVLEADGRVFVFGGEDPLRSAALTRGLDWPTASNVATLLGRAFEALMVKHRIRGDVVRVTVCEGSDVCVTWEPAATSVPQPRNLYRH